MYESNPFECINIKNLKLLRSPILQHIHLGSVVTLGVCLGNIKRDDSCKDTRLLPGTEPARTPLAAIFLGLCDVLLGSWNMNPSVDSKGHLSKILLK